MFPLEPYFTIKGTEVFSKTDKSVHTHTGVCGNVFDLLVQIFHRRKRETLGSFQSKKRTDIWKKIKIQRESVVPFGTIVSRRR